MRNHVTHSAPNPVALVFAGILVASLGLARGLGWIAAVLLYALGGSVLLDTLALASTVNRRPVRPLAIRLGRDRT